jgi:hypothetical protein
MPPVSVSAAPDADAARARAARDRRIAACLQPARRFTLIPDPDPDRY